MVAPKRGFDSRKAPSAPHDVEALQGGVGFEEFGRATAVDFDFLDDAETGGGFAQRRLRLGIGQREGIGRQQQPDGDACPPAASAAAQRAPARRCAASRAKSPTVSKLGAKGITPAIGTRPWVGRQP